MGVFTPLLNLFKPDPTELVDVNAHLNANFDKIDTLAGAIGGGAWQSYTPAWTASVTQPAIGNGVLTGRFLQIGKTVDVMVHILWGSTTSNGNGLYTFSLPPGMVLRAAPSTVYMSAGGMFVGSGFFPLLSILQGGLNTFTLIGNNTSIYHDQPGIWSTGMVISVLMRLEIA